jgi:hypothetical protein
MAKEILKLAVGIVVIGIVVWALMQFGGALY